MKNQPRHPRHQKEESRLHRCFYAVTFDDATVNFLQDTIRSLQKLDLPVRWTPLKNLHLTLRFLGEITNEQLDQACAFPAEELPSPFQLGVQGIGAFPTIRKPKVIWAGIEGVATGDHEALLGLQRTTEEWAQEIGLPAEQRPYTPHVTLGRVRGHSKEFEQVIQSVEQEMGTSAPCIIRELILMRSSLNQSGAVYSPIKVWNLGT